MYQIRRRFARPRLRLVRDGAALAEVGSRHSHGRRANPGGEVSKILLRDASVPQRGVGALRSAGPARPCYRLVDVSRCAVVSAVSRATRLAALSKVWWTDGSGRGLSSLLFEEQAAMLRRVSSARGVKYRMGGDPRCWVHWQHAFRSTACRVPGSHSRGVWRRDRALPRPSQFGGV